MVAGISQQNMHHFQHIRGAFHCQNANAWMRGLFRELQADGHSNQSLVIICDKAPCHTQFQRVFEETEFLSVKFLRMSPYSPALNPIEYAWNSIKSHIKREMSSSHVSTPSIERGTLTLSEARLRRVESAIDNA